MKVALPTNFRIPVEYIGDVRLSSSLMLHNVLFIPNFSYNLISLSCFLKCESICMDFSESHCLIPNKALLRTISKANCTNGLYVLDSSTDFASGVTARACLISIHM